MALPEGTLGPRCMTPPAALELRIGKLGQFFVLP